MSLFRERFYGEDIATEVVYQRSSAVSRGERASDLVRFEIEKNDE